MITDSNLINIKGNILENIIKLDKTTIRSAQDIYRDRKTNQELQYYSFWTSDTPVYTYEKDDAIIYLPEKNNSLLINNDNNKIIRELMNNENYFLSEKEIENILSDNKTTKINISELKLINLSNPHYSYFEVHTKDNTENNDSLNNDQKKFIYKIYGSEAEFKSMMKIMYKTGIRKTKIRVLTPLQILKLLWKNNKNYFARGSSIDSFKQTSDFDATCTYRSNIDKYIRGVELEK